MEKKKIKTIKIQYPAPYSQSWPTPLAKKAKKVTSAALAINPKRIPSRSNDWLKRQTTVCRGCDPTAPHLKYGVFHNKRPIIRIQPRTNNNAKQLKPYPQNEKITVKKQSKKGLRKGDADQPFFVFRHQTIDKSNRQLSKSEIKHMDIKPRAIRPISPVMRVFRRSPPLSPVSRFIKRGD